MPTNHGDGRTTAAKVPEVQPARESPAATRELEFKSARKPRATPMRMDLYMDKTELSEQKLSENSFSQRTAGLRLSTAMVFN